MSFVSPLDLLTASSTEQDVIRCLVRRPHLTATEIAGFTKIPIKELEALLKQMINDSRLAEQKQDKGICFEVPFGNEKKNTPKGNSLLDRLFY